MITTHEAFEILTTTSTELKNHWDAYLQREYANEHNFERLIYLDISEIGRFITNKFIKRETENFEFFFEKVEMILIEGDDATRNLMAVGLLEGLQDGSIGLHNEDFTRWLKPVTKAYWDDLIFLFRTSKLKQKWLRFVAAIKKYVL